jgi:glucokinase
MKQNYVGIDIGGTKCAISFGCANSSTGAMEICEKKVVKTMGNSPIEILEVFKSAIEEYKEMGNILGIGISCGGPLNSAQGVILGPPNLPGWDHVEIVKYYRDIFNVPVFLQNDANACAMAEWRYGAGRGCDNLIFMTFGTGLGAGFILNGRLYTGANDMAGEVGHIRLSESGPIGYGKAGSFEGFCSGGGIAQIAKMRVRAGESPELLKTAGSEENITAKLVGTLAEGGDPFCRDVYAQSGRMLGKGLSILIDILNPQRIIIGSIFARSHDLLWKYAQEVIDREALVRNVQACSVLPSGLGESLGDVAALSVAIGTF